MKFEKNAPFFTLPPKHIFPVICSGVLPFYFPSVRNCSEAAILQKNLPREFKICMVGWKCIFY